MLKPKRPQGWFSFCIDGAFTVGGRAVGDDTGVDTGAVGVAMVVVGAASGEGAETGDGIVLGAVMSPITGTVYGALSVAGIETGNGIVGEEIGAG